ncbi:hypothetical protein K437DRAFT_229073 [Tilletiaria anomala UBC 951]|uniref:C2H2-type domain-containing protein n=1 Tax=Tilletiaria anomala (strain ATCC 24038 / CBS 436.72 / UBC 951) TaxID=1037660 RepID=A0A066V854_TILAU|nr:uncharacterized protein K437DRAFT_229073 [Tilletiaria anomala UBC 951]KDN37671.1 hypothetical protein K437DRAFT_229073 [Tilletiaria anomala UBC 951]
MRSRVHEARYEGCQGAARRQVSSKQQRRCWHEVDRQYQCNAPGCSKAYGRLHHLNTHIMARGHGEKRRQQGELIALLVFCPPRQQHRMHKTERDVECLGDGPRRISTNCGWIAM